MSLTELGTRLRAVRRHLDGQAGEARALARRGKDLQRQINDLAAQIEDLQQAAAVLTSISEVRQAALQTQIETLVTQGLRAIFDEPLSLRLVPGVRAKTPVLDLIVRSTLLDGTTVDTDILDARGGGLAAIVGFLLRLTILLLRPEEGPAILVLDESFAHVSAEYEARLAAFIAHLVTRTGVQIILVTHSDAYREAADTRWRFGQHAGATTVRPG